MPRIAIAGAGIAGLNAALTLQDTGLSCDLYEASSRVGGRIHSDSSTWADGMVSELCGEFIDGDHDTMHQLVKRFNLPTVDLEKKRGGWTQRVQYFCGRYYSMEEMAHDFQQIAPTLRQQMQATGFPTTHAHFTETACQLDHLSIYDWIEQYVPGGHTRPPGRMLDNSCTGYFGLDSHLQSSLNLLYMFGPRTSITSGTIQGSIKILGGNEQLPQAIAQTLPQASIHLNHQLLAISRAANNEITLSFSTAVGISNITCDHLILALPFSTLRHIDYSQAGFDALKHTAITELGYGTISKLFLQFDTPYWYQDGPWPRANSGFIITDLDIQTLWDTSIGQPGDSGLLVDYTSGHRGAAYTPPTPYSTTTDSRVVQHYAQQCLAQLELVFPGITPHYTGTAALSYPTGDPFLLGSYSCWKVGQFTGFAGYEKVRQGPIHFAGEHCSVEFQGFMEGGAREGARAAQEILHDYGLA